VALVLSSRLIEGPSHVDRLSFINPTVYDLHVDATDGARQGWVPLGTARRGETTAVEEVLDQGDAWIFRFSGQGEQGGELRLRREQLEGDGWKVVIPERTGAELQAKGAPPSP
jgi:hypothetical protein